MATRRKHKTKLNINDAESLINFLESRAKKNGEIKILINHLARLAYLAGEDPIEIAPGIINDPFGETKLNHALVLKLTQKAMKLLYCGYIQNNWAELFDILYIERESKNIPHFRRKIKKKRSKRRL